MKKPNLFSVYAILIFAAFFIIGCSDDKGKGDYSGVGKLVAERNQARMANAGRGKNKEGSSSDSVAAKQRSTQMVFEEEVKIIRSSSGNILAKATAYLANSGKIINIRIKRK